MITTIGTYSAASFKYKHPILSNPFMGGTIATIISALADKQLKGISKEIVSLVDDYIRKGESAVQKDEELRNDPDVIDDIKITKDEISSAKSELNEKSELSSKVIKKLLKDIKWSIKLVKKVDKDEAKKMNDRVIQVLKSASSRKS